MEKKKLRSHCPVNYTLELFGDKWTLLILRDMIIRKKQYFSEFQSAEESIASNILTDRLQKLESYGLISSSPNKIKKIRKCYRLTEKGISTLPIILEMILWGTANDDNSDTPKWMIERLTSDRDAYILELVENYKNNSYEGGDFSS